MAWSWRVGVVVVVVVGEVQPSSRGAAFAVHVGWGWDVGGVGDAGGGGLGEAGCAGFDVGLGGG